MPTRVLNTEMTGLASAMMLGPLIGGVTIDVFGLGVAFAVPACSRLFLGAAVRGSRRNGGPSPAARPVVTVPQSPEAGLIGRMRRPGTCYGARGRSW